MKSNLKREVARLSKGTDFKLVLKEAIVNSIQAKASDIRVKFSLDQSEDQDTMSLDGDAKYEFNSISVSDNGDGFNAQNIASFEEIGSEYKSDLGCLGRGRLSYLKAFDDVTVKSLSKDGQYSEQTFSLEFKQWDGLKGQKDGESFTDIRFHGYKKSERGFSPIKLKQEIALHILPLLSLKNRNSEFKITFLLGTEEVAMIQLSDIPVMTQDEIMVTNSSLNDNPQTPFTLRYFIKQVDHSERPLLDGYYVSSGRVVHKFSNKEKLGESARIQFSKIKGFQILFFLSSSYFDDDRIISSERDGFDIPKTNASSYELSWRQINFELKQKVNEIIKSDESLQFLEGENQKSFEKIEDEHLHLASYIKDSAEAIGSLNKDNVLQVAERKFAEDKAKFRKNKSQMSPEELLSEASRIAGKELIEYIQMRDHVISKLEELANDVNSKEEQLHNLIVDMKSHVTQENTISLENNNLWLLDDKFMGFSKIASDKELNQILDIQRNDNSSGVSGKRRPDIAAFYRDSGRKKLVLFELKKTHAGTFDATKGIDQLGLYAQKFREQGVEEIYMYLVSGLDEEAEIILKNRQFKTIYSSSGKSLFGIVGEVPCMVFVLDPEAVIADARARNQVFIDMVKENTISDDEKNTSKNLPCE